MSITSVRVAVKLKTERVSFWLHLGGVDLMQIGDTLCIHDYHLLVTDRHFHISTGPITPTIELRTRLIARPSQGVVTAKQFEDIIFAFGSTEWIGSEPLER